MSLGIIHASLALAPRRTAKRRDLAECALSAPHQVLTRIIKRQSVVGTESSQQIVYCVALEPNTLDLHKHIMTYTDVEYTAHRFMQMMAKQDDAQMVRSMHEDPIRASVVESYIAPQDLMFKKGTYGPQMVKKGSWVLGIKVRDPAEWAKVVAGEYTGISVGGVGLLGSI